MNEKYCRPLPSIATPGSAGQASPSCFGAGKTADACQVAPPSVDP
jgi:hypothetical protein